MSHKVVDLKDVTGCRIGILLDIDGVMIPMFGKPADEAAEHMQAISNLQLRDDDVMLLTYGKAGTHWSFEILSMLLKRKAEREPTHKVNLMMEAITVSDLESMPSPRILNTHVPTRLLPQQLKEKRNKILVTMRNPKDIVVSLFYHAKGEKMFNYDGKFEDFLLNFMEDNVPYGGWFHHTLDIEKAMDSKEYDIHLTFFEDLKENGVGEIKKIAKFLEVDVDDALCQAIHDMCSFDKMAVEKAPPKPIVEKMFRGGFSIFRKGKIGDWKNHFTVAQNEAFDEVYAEKMSSSKLKFRFVAKDNE